jgi:hypothetical protein
MITKHIRLIEEVMEQVIHEMKLIIWSTALKLSNTSRLIKIFIVTNSSFFHQPSFNQLF